MIPLVGFEFVTPQPVFSSTGTQNILYKHEDNDLKCVRCNHTVCDVKVHGCECSFHVRCITIDKDEKIELCPHCRRPTSGLTLIPMSFVEVDEARKSASGSKVSFKHGPKRKGSTIFESEFNDDNGSIASSDTDIIQNEDKSYKEISISDCRTGRWTDEEIIFCDALISIFKQGQLPLAKGVKLNDFLTSMLKSKPSRLTKKMKSAKLSSVTFTLSSPYIKSDSECQTFSTLEENFFKAVQDPGERAKLKFHVRHEWRDMFHNFCVHTRKKLDADAWLTSVDEMDRRNSIARDASRMKRRKVMMANAIAHDSSNVEAGVFIENVATMRTNDLSKTSCGPLGSDASERDDILLLLMDDVPTEGNKNPTCILDDITPEVNGKSSIMHSSPFLHKVSAFMKRRSIPFEQADIWVPSLNRSDGLNYDPKCRLMFAGCTTMDFVIPAAKVGPPEAMSPELKFNLLSFGDYSQNFSFAAGYGVPGRVYSTGIFTWEQNVQAAPSTHFERCGGAKQWGIKTVLGIPIPSPNIGQIVIVLYSVHNRKKCEQTVLKLQNEFTKLLPTPKWKLVIDVGSLPAVDDSPGSTASTQTAPAASTSVATNGSVSENLICLLGNEMPMNEPSTLPSQMQTLMSLRLLLLRQRRNTQEEDIVNTILASYKSYTTSGRCNSEIAIMLARDFNLLTQIRSTVTQPSNTMVYQQLPAIKYSNLTPLPGQLRQDKGLVQEHLNLSQLLHNDQGSSSYDACTKYSGNEVLFDQKSSMYTGFDEARLDNSFRPDSPALTPIVAPGDGLCIDST